MDSVHLRDLDSDCIGTDGKESEAAADEYFINECRDAPKCVLTRARLSTKSLGTGEAAQSQSTNVPVNVPSPHTTPSVCEDRTGGC